MTTEIDLEQQNSNNNSEKRSGKWGSSEPLKKVKTSEWDEPDQATTQKKLSRWDTPTASGVESIPTGIPSATPPRRRRWDETPDKASSSIASTPLMKTTPQRSRWDETPDRSAASLSDNESGREWDETPKKIPTSETTTTPSKKTRSRWDETPVASLPMGAATPAANFGQTPAVGAQVLMAATPENIQMLRRDREIEERNRPWNDDELDAIFPTEGYKILEVPSGYVPPARKIAVTPSPMASAGFVMQDGETVVKQDFGVTISPSLPEMKPEDIPFFQKLLKEEDEQTMTPEEAKERKIMKLLLKVKNGTPPQRKQALRQLTDKAREFGPSALFNQILPLLMSPALEDQERHLLVKVIDRILYKLDDLVRPFVHKILVVIEPLLIDEDYYARCFVAGTLLRLMDGRTIDVAHLGIDLARSDRPKLIGDDAQPRSVCEPVRARLGTTYRVSLRPHGPYECPETMRVSAGHILVLAPREPVLTRIGASPDQWELRYIEPRSARDACPQWIRRVFSCPRSPEVHPQRRYLYRTVLVSSPREATRQAKRFFARFLADLPGAVFIPWSPAGYGVVVKWRRGHWLYQRRWMVPVNGEDQCSYTERYPFEKAARDAAYKMALRSLRQVVEMTVEQFRDMSSECRDCYRAVRLNRAVSFQSSGFLGPSNLSSDLLFASYGIRPAALATQLASFQNGPSAQQVLSSRQVKMITSDIFLSPSARKQDEWQRGPSIGNDKDDKKIVSGTTGLGTNGDHRKENSVGERVSDTRRGIHANHRNPIVSKAIAEKTLTFHYNAQCQCLRCSRHKSPSGPLTETTKQIPFAFLTASVEARYEFIASCVITSGGVWIDPENDSAIAWQFVQPLSEKPFFYQVYHMILSLGFACSLPSILHCCDSLEEQVKHPFLRIVFQPTLGSSKSLPISKAFELGKSMEYTSWICGYGIDVEMEEEPSVFYVVNVKGSTRRFLLDNYLIVHNCEGREIISNLAKAAGLATMIATMRPDIDNPDEYVRNTTARAFSVVASALGIPALLPFLKAVCQSKKSWQARHTGIKIVQQIAILMGCAVLPHLKSLVEIIEHGLGDEQQKVRTITALALAALAEAATPYGIESFDSVLKPLWYGIREHRGKGLAAFLKAIGFIIPLMDAEYASYYTKEVMVILIREFATPDEEMKKIVLKVVKQCVGTEGVEAAYVKQEILPEFFKHFWVRRMALDRRNYKQLVDTTVELANKVGGAEIIRRVVEELKDESEPFRKMVMETIDNVVKNLGTSEVDARLEEQLIDGLLYAFQEQSTDDSNVMLNGIGTVINALGLRVKPYLPQLAGTIKWRLNNKSAKVRQQAADLISRIAVTMKACGEEQLMGHLGTVLYEYLGEEYPEVLGSILSALKAIVNVIGMTKMTPPIKDLLPRLTPILKNRHEKVQENCIDLVGRIADRGAEFVSAREWMRICFELLDMLKAHKKGIRRAAVNTFGYIAKAIGPSDVLATLLNNLKVQERQNRVCTTVAIAIVAETCSPYTVLPALMNEYRVPELNVQNGVLKALSFMFEYIGEMGKDYIYAVTPLLEDALMDRDLVHRQTACTVVKHISLGVYGLGCEDALRHLLNFVWPNIFETSPHVINAVTEAVEGASRALGPSIVLSYVLQGLFHPARKVREIYWKVYNNLYIGHQDALVAFYPRVPEDPINSYRRAELDYVL